MGYGLIGSWSIVLQGSNQLSHLNSKDGSVHGFFMNDSTPWVLYSCVSKHKAISTLWNTRAICVARERHVSPSRKVFDHHHATMNANHNLPNHLIAGSGRPLRTRVAMAAICSIISGLTISSGSARAFSMLVLGRLDSPPVWDCISPVQGRGGTS